MCYQAESALWFSREILRDETELLQRVEAVVSARNRLARHAADKTSSLRSQYERLSSALGVIKVMRSNLQTNFNQELAEFLVKDTMCETFKAVMSRGHEFVSNVELFQKAVVSLLNSAKTILGNSVSEENSSQICRILFLRLTDHITFRKFRVSDSRVWKQCQIVARTIEEHRAEILREVEADQPETFVNKSSYFERACELLSRIRSNSNLSVILYYVLEAIGLVHTLCDICRDLNFDGCLLWVLVSTPAKHVYLLSHFIQHFVLNRGKFLDILFAREEITLLGVFPSAVMLLLKECKKYNDRINVEWAFIAGDDTPRKLSGA
jgi:hypothetical protein